MNPDHASPNSPPGKQRSLVLQVITLILVSSFCGSFLSAGIPGLRAENAITANEPSNDKTWVWKTVGALFESVGSLEYNWVGT